MPSRARLLTPYSWIWPVSEPESRVILPLAKHKLLRVHLLKLRPVKASKSNDRQGRQTSFRYLRPVVLRKSCKVLQTLHGQKKRKATIIHLQCFARGRKRDYYIIAPDCKDNCKTFLQPVYSLVILSHLFNLPSWAEHRQNRP